MLEGFRTTAPQPRPSSSMGRSRGHQPHRRPHWRGPGARQGGRGVGPVAPPAAADDRRPCAGAEVSGGAGDRLHQAGRGARSALEPGCGQNRHTPQKMTSKLNASRKYQAVAPEPPPSIAPEPAIVVSRGAPLPKAPKIEAAPERQPEPPRAPARAPEPPPIRSTTRRPAGPVPGTHQTNSRPRRAKAGRGPCTSEGAQTAGPRGPTM
jgi:hypothetical protein